MVQSGDASLPGASPLCTTAFWMRIVNGDVTVVHRLLRCDQCGTHVDFPGHVYKGRDASAGLVCETRLRQCNPRKWRRNKAVMRKAHSNRGRLQPSPRRPAAAPLICGPRHASSGRFRKRQCLPASALSPSLLRSVPGPQRRVARRLRAATSVDGPRVEGGSWRSVRPFGAY